MATGSLGLTPVRRLEADEVSPFGGVLQKALANYKALTEAQYQGKNLEQDLKNKVANSFLHEAQAKRANAQANLPGGGVSIPGPAGQIMGLEIMKHIYGEDSPEYKAAQNSLNLSNESTRSRSNYQNKLSDTLPIRYTTPEGRGFIEESNVSQGASPAGTPEGQPVVPGGPVYKSPYEKNEDAAGQYQLERVKKNLPATVQQRNLSATNIEKTLDSIDPKALTQYGGYLGKLQQKGQEHLSGFNLESKNFDEYKDSKDAVDLLATQVRQFYGDSIQPIMLERLQKLSDPASWQTNPKLAKEIYSTTKNILEKEMQTYRDAARNANVYQGKPANAKQAINETANNFKSQSIHMVGPDGKEYDVPQGKAQRFIENGFKRK